MSVRLAGGVLAALLSCCLPLRVHAEGLVLYGGISQEAGSDAHAVPWALEYTEPVARPLELGMLYLNQGHFVGHHRDGIGAEMFLRTPSTAHGWSFAAGAGPLYYFDTTGTGANYANHHGLGWIFSANAQWQFHRRWFMALRAQHVDARKSFDTTSFMIGLGYRWSAGLTEEERESGVAPIPPRELDVFLGRTVVNSFSSEHSLAISIEYRQQLRRWLDWTATWLNEGDARLIRRNGVATQVWLVRHAHNDRVQLGAGLGPYIALDRYRHEDGVRPETVSGLVSLTARYSLTPQWHVRTTWHRVLANYHRDTDVFLLGLGYGF